MAAFRANEITQSCDTAKPVLLKRNPFQADTGLIKYRSFYQTKSKGPVRAGNRATIVKRGKMKLRTSHRKPVTSAPTSARKKPPIKKNAGKKVPNRKHAR